MKRITKRAISILNNALILIINRRFFSFCNFLFIVKLNVSRNFRLFIKESIFERVSIIENGRNNLVRSERAKLSNCVITIQGSNNLIEIEQGVKLNQTNLNVKGDDLKIFIGANTQINGARIVNHGNGCLISIGENCLFSDFIEIWSSDTHKIKENGVTINKEKDILIKDNVWLGSKVTLLKGSIIESNVVVGIGSIVSGTLSEGSVYAGIPAKVIKRNTTWEK